MHKEFHNNLASNYFCLSYINLFGNVPDIIQHNHVEMQRKSEQ